MVQNVVQRAGVISYGTLAEIDHFQHSRCVDFKDAMTTFLTGQINFYQEVSQKWKVSYVKLMVSFDLCDLYEACNCFTLKVTYSKKINAYADKPRKSQRVIKGKKILQICVASESSTFLFCY